MTLKRGDDPIARKWQDEDPYSVNGLTCLHWGAVSTSLTQRAGAGGEAGGRCFTW